MPIWFAARGGHGEGRENLFGPFGPAAETAASKPDPAREGPNGPPAADPARCRQQALFLRLGKTYTPSLPHAVIDPFVPLAPLAPPARRKSEL